VSISNRLTVVLVMSCVICCARDPGHVNWSVDYLTAERQLEKGETAKARRGFARLEKTARFSGDKILLQIRTAESFRRDGSYANAARILDELIRQRGNKDAELEAKLIYLRARVDLDRGNDDLGEKRLGQLMRRFSGTTFGLRAFQILRSRYKARDKNAFLDWCERHYVALKASPLADNFLYESGLVNFELKTAAGDKKAAVYYTRIRKLWRFETSPLWDDATWELSLVRHRQGKYRAEIGLLRDLLSTREPTWLWGSYDISNYKHAAFRIGMVYYENLKDYVEAARQFNAYPTLFEKSRYRDDAIWWEAQSWLRAGKQAKATDAFNRLLEEHPKSLYAARIRKGNFSA